MQISSKRKFRHALSTWLFLNFKIVDNSYSSHNLARSLPSFSSSGSGSRIRRPEFVSRNTDDADYICLPQAGDNYEMVQTYGVARPDPSDPNSAGGDESSALLGGAVSRPKREGNAGLVSSVSNLANTIIGSGELAHTDGAMLIHLQGMLTFPMVCLPGHLKSHNKCPQGYGFCRYNTRYDYLLVFRVSRSLRAVHFLLMCRQNTTSCLFIFCCRPVDFPQCRRIL